MYIAYGLSKNFSKRRKFFTMSKVSPPVVNKNDSRKNLKHGYKKEDLFVRKFYANFDLRRHLPNLDFDHKLPFYELPVSQAGVTDLAFICWKGKKGDFPQDNSDKSVEQFIKKNKPKIVAIEAKYKDISKCARKAYKYSLYSHFSFAVMPNSMTSLIKKRKELKKLKSGFLTMDEESGNIDEIYKAKRQTPLCTIALFFAIRQMVAA